MNVLIKLCVPIEHADAANRLAYIIDPGSTGDQTFVVRSSADGNEPATHVMCNTWMAPDYADLLRSRDPQAYMQPLLQLSSERGRPSPMLTDCEAMTQSILIDSDIAQQPIRQDVNV